MWIITVDFKFLIHNSRSVMSVQCSEGFWSFKKLYSV